LAISSYSQDFEFIWKVWPSFDISYTLKIREKNSDRIIIIKQTSSNDSIINKIEKRDCNMLVGFLNNYDFPNKGNIVYGPKIRIYNDTKVLKDTNWVIISKDSVRRESLWIYGYLFDNDSNKFYEESQKAAFITDGNTYTGEYINANERKNFTVHNARISSKDYELNKLVYSFILKYGSKSIFVHLGKLIESDKPRIQQ
jgi:hypothetical protein